MAFITEPTGYEKTAISDLQGTWTNLREAVVEHFGFPESDKLLFHIDEAMSWESVRDLNAMRRTLLLVQNIANQTNAPEDVVDCIEQLRDSFDEAIGAIAEGRAE